MRDDHFKGFCDELRAEVAALLGDRTKAVEERQDAMFRRQRGFNGERTI